MLQRKSIIIQGLNIGYYQSENIDKANVLVFLHGWGSQAMHFRKTLERCESVVAIDLPGFGNSEAPSCAWSLDDYVNFVKDLLKKIDIKNPIIAGHSFGGSIGIKYCAQGNDVRKLILIGSAGIRKKTAKKYGLLIISKLFGLIFSLPGLHTLKIIVKKWFYKTIDSEDYLNAGALTETFKKVVTEDLIEDFKKINVPTILIWGEDDQSTPVADGKRMNSLIVGSQLHIIPNAGHYVFLDNEKEFNKIFLAQIK